MKITSTRIDTAYYTVSDGESSVSVWKIQDAPPGVHWWVAVADWDNKLYDGPLPTKAAAVQSARLMIVTTRQ